VLRRGVGRARGVRRDATCNIRRRHAVVGRSTRAADGPGGAPACPGVRAPLWAAALRLAGVGGRGGGAVDGGMQRSRENCVHATTLALVPLNGLGGGDFAHRCCPRKVGQFIISRGARSYGHYVRSSKHAAGDRRWSESDTGASPAACRHGPSRAVTPQPSAGCYAPSSSATTRWAVSHELHGPPPAPPRGGHTLGGAGPQDAATRGFSRGSVRATCRALNSRDLGLNTLGDSQYADIDCKWG